MAKTVVARPGPHFVASDGTRAVKPIFGSSGDMRLGDVLVDHDCCDLNGNPLHTPEAWKSAFAGQKLGEVAGSFAIAGCGDDGAIRLARDAIGHRTIFWTVEKGTLFFGSRIHDVLARSGKAPSVNLAAVARYLCYAYIPGNSTLVDGIFEVLPGEEVTFRQGDVKRRRLWDLPIEPRESEFLPEEELRKRLRTQLQHLMNVMVPEDRAAGATLSGGIDSSLVVALAAKQSRFPLQTFSVSFGAKYPNELEFSSAVASHCRTEHTIVELIPETVLCHLDDSIALLSKPIGDPLTVPNAVLFREAAKHTNVVFNGEGGDPCFGGPKNVPMLLAEHFGDGGDPREDDGLGRERSYLRSHLKCYDELEPMLAPRVRDAIAGNVLERELTTYFTDARAWSFIGKLMSINVTFKGGHHILPKVDEISAAFGVLPRSVLFHRRMVELAFAIPAQMKLKGSIEKWLLKEAVADLLPQQIIERPKSGMMVPVEKWFENELLQHARERLLDGLSTWNLIDRKWMEALLAKKLGGLRPRRGVKIWLLVTLEAWLRKTLGGAR